MTKEERIEYCKQRIELAHSTFDAAKLLIENGYYNSAINRLYYSIFYVVSALLVLNEIDSQTHSGLRSQFSQHYIKTNILDKKYGKLLVQLYDWRQQGDYDSLCDFSKKTLLELIEPINEMLYVVENEINKTI
ncbi:MAG: HEPN domain-containing protein [Bacteroidales bacterium]|nr:HEPN domain-containing protein [Bacteroidales bacterium]